MQTEKIPVKYFQLNNQKYICASVRFLGQHHMKTNKSVSMSSQYLEWINLVVI